MLLRCCLPSRWFKYPAPLSVLLSLRIVYKDHLYPVRNRCTALLLLRINHIVTKQYRYTQSPWTRPNAPTLSLPIPPLPPPSPQPDQAAAAQALSLPRSMRTSGPTTPPSSPVARA
ncbi:hypothetical protein FJTKL_01476 [Diaporthe vaccinii]|uniref:Uncharacterized protein n=1 Tax=Diaporthe vaccinii TaxID=105482 RepID=A0ABR4E0H8_9PEZI